MKRGLDQTSAWVLAIALGGIIFAAGYFLTRAGGKHGDPDMREGEAVDGSAEPAGEGAKAEAKDGKGEGGEERVAPAAEGEKAEKKEEHEGAKKEEHEGAKKEGHAGGEHAAAPPKVHWEYKGSSGPDHWGELADVFRTCAAGKHQSPIDIDGPATNQKLLPIRFTYKDADLLLKNDGKTIEATVPTGNFVEIDGERYDLVQFHFHAPSEHKIAGAPYDFELHLVHRSTEGKLAVIAVLFEEGAVNKAIANLWKALPAPGESSPEPFAFDPAGLLPSRHVYYHYEGSLTTPPCTEGVQWFVMTQALEISGKQVDAFTHLVPFNARPVQPLAGRHVVKSAR